MPENCTVLHVVLTFFALIMAFVTLWVKRSPWIWGSFLAIAGLLAYLSQILFPLGLIPIGALLLCHSLIDGFQKFTRFLIFLIATSVSIGLWFHLWPGFHNYLVYDKVSLSAASHPYTLYLNFDKPFVGFFVLAFSLPLLSSFKQMFKVAIPLSILGMIVIGLLAVFGNLVAWDPKFPSSFWLFALDNLFLVAIPEEAFLRGFVQNEVFRWFGGNGKWAGFAAVFLTAILFAALHIKWVASWPFLGLIFVAGLVYGAIYQITRSIEASMLCHFLVNIVHFTLFTYPLSLSVQLFACGS